MFPPLSLCSCAPALLQAEPASGTAPPPAYTTATTELFVPDSVLLEVGEHLVFSAPHPDSEAVLKVRVSANNWTKQAGPFLSERGIKIDVVRCVLRRQCAPAAVLSAHTYVNVCRLPSTQLRRLRLLPRVA